MNTHVVAQGSSGKFWCCECFVRTITIAELSAIECHPEYLEE